MYAQQWILEGIEEWVVDVKERGQDLEQGGAVGLMAPSRLTMALTTTTMAKMLLLWRVKVDC